MIVTGLIVSGYAGVAWVGSRTWADSVPSAVLVAALYGSVLLVVILLILAFFAAALPQMLERNWNAFHPDVVVVSSLVQTLFLLSWDGPEALKAIGGRLRYQGLAWSFVERAAEATRRGLPSLLARSDSVGLYEEGIALEGAAGLRELKPDVAIHLARTESADRKAALGRMVAALNAWIGGGVDELPRGKPEPLPQRPTDKAAIVRRIVALVAPLLVLLVVRLSGCGFSTVGGRSDDIFDFLVCVGSAA
jgi:hypothetical protein